MKKRRKTISKLPAARSDKQDVQFIEEGTYFDGEKQVLKRVEVPEHINFEIEVKLKSDVQGDQIYSNGPNTPPMPFLVGPVSIYENLKGYTIGVKDRSDNPTYIEVGCRPLQWQTIQIKRLPEEIRVSLNGSDVGSVNGDFDFPSRVILGRGYLERRWRGWISSFSVEEVNADGRKQSVFILP